MEKPLIPNESKILPLSARYLGAWREYNTRIDARHSLTRMYLTVSTLLIAAVYSNLIGQVANKQLGLLCLFALPLAALNFFSQLSMHDAMMGRLHHYMRTLEDFDNADHYLPSYHCNPLWCRNFIVVRSFQNLAFAVVSVIMFVAGLYGAYDLVANNALLLNGYIAMCLLSQYLNWRGYKVRQTWISTPLEKQTDAETKTTEKTDV